MPAMKRLALVYHPKIPRAIELAHAWAEQLKALGANPLVFSGWDDAELARHLDSTDLFVTLGGDGTLLHVARIAAANSAAAIGVKLGRQGFLSEILPEHFPELAPKLLDGAYWIEERLMLDAALTRAGQTLGTYTALNDVVVSRGELARVIRVATFIDDDLMTTYIADGVIVATATGSTAYSLACGGPILAPEVKTLVLTPIAPYLSPIRSVVLPEGARVRLQLQSHDQSILTIDGQMDVQMQFGDQVSVAASPYLARFARLQPRTYFYGTLAARLRERGLDNDK
jgi:NAD+ kinase